MIFRFIPLLVVVSMASRNMIAFSCPDNCQCYVQFNSVVCDVSDDGEGHNLLKQLKKVIYRLEITGYQHLHIPLHFFRNFTIQKFFLSNNRIKEGLDLPRGIESLILSYNNLTRVDFFRLLLQRLVSLHSIDVEHNDINIGQQQHFVTGLIFKAAPNLITFKFSNNKIQYLSKYVFKNLRKLKYIYMENCNIEQIHSDAFLDQIKLSTLLLRGNKLKSLPDSLLSSGIYLNDLRLARNLFKTIPLIKGPQTMSVMDYSGNEIEDISSLKLSSVKSVASLLISNNRIRELSQDTFDSIKISYSLDVSFNRLMRIEKHVLRNSKMLKVINWSNNKISFIHPEAFDGPDNLMSIYLNANQIPSLPNEIFKGHGIKNVLLHHNKLTKLNRPFVGQRNTIKLVTLFDNDIPVLGESVLRDLGAMTTLYISCDKLAVLNTTLSSTSEVNCSPGKTFTFEVDDIVVTSLRYGGFECERDSDIIFRPFNFAKCTSCDTGHYNNGQEKCRRCPRGGFYQDQIAQSNCKHCNPGQFVDKGAGKSSLDCQTCPAGTDPNRFANTRACYCLRNFARRGRFGSCERCTESGVACINGTETLSSEYWWYWHNKTALKQFLCFKENLANDGEDYNSSCNNYLGKLPRIYKCLYKNACLGGMNATCHENYTGPLCSVCKPNYYQTYLGCKRCTRKSLSVLKLLIAPAIIVLCALLFRWMDGMVVDEICQRTLADLFLSVTKILLGYYQILAVIIRLLTDVDWPKIMIDFSTSFYQIILEIFYFPSLKCIHPKLEINANIEMLIACVIMMAIPSLAYLLMRFHISRYLNKTGNFHEDNAARDVKRMYLRAVLMLYFVLYPSVCQRIFQVMPFNCVKLCLDRDGRVCQSYLRVDYRVECPSTSLSNNIYVYISYAALIMPVGFPLVLLILLWYSHRNIEDGNQFVAANNIIVYATRFCYENYKSSYWYWEVFEMMRKFLFAVGFAFFGLGTRTSLGYMIIISGVSTMSYAYFKPIKHNLEHLFQIISLSCLFITLCVGVVLRISPYAVVSRDGDRNDQFAIVIIMAAINTIPVIAVLCKVIKVVVLMIYRRCCR